VLKITGLFLASWRTTRSLSQPHLTGQVTAGNTGTSPAPAAKWRASTRRALRPYASGNGNKDRRGSLAGELRQELFALTGTQTTDAALSGDPGALHDRSGAGLADARQRADDLGDPRLAGQVIIAAQHISEGEGACSQAGQQGRSGGARLTSLLQRCLALLGG
jgi:hypothetical protein